MAASVAGSTTPDSGETGRRLQGLDGVDGLGAVEAVDRRGVEPERGEILLQRGDVLVHGAGRLGVVREASGVDEERDVGLLEPERGSLHVLCCLGERRGRVDALELGIEITLGLTDLPDVIVGGLGRQDRGRGAGRGTGRRRLVGGGDGVGQPIG